MSLLSPYIFPTRFDKRGASFNGPLSLASSWHSLNWKHWYALAFCIHIYSIGGLYCWEGGGEVCRVHASRFRWVEELILVGHRSASDHALFPIFSQSCYPNLIPFNISSIPEVSWARKSRHQGDIPHVRKYLSITSDVTCFLCWLLPSRPIQCQARHDWRAQPISYTYSSWCNQDEPSPD